MIGSKGDALQGVELDAAIDYVRKHPEVWEVILTGGDHYRFQVDGLPTFSAGWR